jgi:hypothetical protein
MKPDFSRSIQTTTLIELLRAAPIGSIIEYETMSDATGEEIQYEGRHYLYTAVAALYEEGVAFGTVRTVGVKRLVSEEIPAIGESAIQRIRRSSKRARKRMGVINGMNDVPNETRVRVNTAASLLGAIENFSGTKARKTVEAEVEKIKGPLPPMKILDALKD